MKKIASGLGTALLIGVVVAWKLFGASAEVALENATDTRWNDARADVKTETTETVNSFLEGMDIEQAVFGKISDCATDK